MIGARQLALVGGALAIARGAAASPTTLDVDGCPFDRDDLAAAVARELTALGPEVAVPALHVRCQPGAALLRLGDDPVAREIELADVPPELAPRVIALVLVAALVERAAVASEPRPADPDSTAPDATGPRTPASTPAPTRTAAATAPGPAARPTAPPTTLTAPAFAPATDRTPWPARPHRRPTLLADRRGRLGATARALTRSYRGTPDPLWGVAAGVVYGPLSLGASHARATVDHTLGELRASVTAVDAALTLACSRAETTTCLGARVEVGRGAIRGVAAGANVTADEVAGLAVHGAAELTIARELGPLEVAGVLALGGGAGVVARASGEEAASLAGWTLGAAVEVRR